MQCTWGVRRARYTMSRQVARMQAEQQIISRHWSVLSTRARCRPTAGRGLGMCACLRHALATRRTTSRKGRLAVALESWLWASVLVSRALVQIDRCPRADGRSVHMGDMPLLLASRNRARVVAQWRHCCRGQERLRLAAVERVRRGVNIACASRHMPVQQRRGCCHRRRQDNL